MTDATLAPAAAGYLAQLEAALAAVDPATRDEILAGVREELVGRDAAAVTARIRELGDPEFIAAEARAAAGAGAASTSAGVPDAADAQPLPQASVAASGPEAHTQSPREPAWFSVIAGLLVMIGGVIVPVVGAVAGYVMMWFSSAWTRRQKIVATAIPIVYLGVLIAGITVGSTLRQQGVSTSDRAGSGGFYAPASEDFTESAAQNPLLPASYDLIASGITVGVLVLLGVGIWLLVVARRNWATRA